METNLIAWAVPGFVVLIAWELVLGWRRGRSFYSFRDTITNLGCGMGSQIAGLLVTPLGVGAYALVHEAFGIFDLVSQERLWLVWAIGIVGTDFCYYWTHRYSHEWSLLWAAHVVHHQSPRYNFSVALRQSAFHGLATWLFYLPLAVIGVPTEVFVASYAINLLYQFFIHTEAIRQLGPLEWVLNTPSHHRVHHGRNWGYLDRNYGGILIIWDRLFRTFTKEEAPVDFGTLKPFTKWNPVSANIGPVIELVRGAAALPSWRQRLLFLFKNPGWQPGDRTVEDAVRRALTVHDGYPVDCSPTHPSQLLATMILFIITVIGTVALMGWAELAAWPWRLVAGLFLITCMGLWSLILNRDAKASELRSPLLRRDTVT